MNVLEAIEALPDVTSFENIIKQALPTGLFMEFGVYQGGSIKIIASLTNQQVYGFDSFEGLPEEWNDLPKGHFKCSMPTDLPSNVSLIKGMFEDSLPAFLKCNDEKISLVHIDCDLYSSTKCIFDNLKDRFQDGSIVIFDELYGYEGYEDHEYKAFNEFLEDTKYTWECIGKYSAHQAGFKIYV